VPAHVRHKVESLRHKRDSVATKLSALGRHRGDRWRRALGAVEHAREEMKDSWRTLVHSLRREGHVQLSGSTPASERNS